MSIHIDPVMNGLRRHVTCIRRSRRQPTRTRLRLSRTSKNLTSAVQTRDPRAGRIDFDRGGGPLKASRSVFPEQRRQATLIRRRW